jgi:hypothetical protein
MSVASVSLANNRQSNQNLSDRLNQGQLIDISDEELEPRVSPSRNQNISAD